MKKQEIKDIYYNFVDDNGGFDFEYFTYEYRRQGYKSIYTKRKSLLTFLKNYIDMSSWSNFAKGYITDLFIFDCNIYL